MGDYWSDNGADPAPSAPRPESREPLLDEVEIIHLDHWQMAACALGGFVLGALTMFKVLGGISL